VYAANVSEALTTLGGARIVLATATSSEAMAATVGGLAPDGRVIVLGADSKPTPLVTAGLIAARTGTAGRRAARSARKTPCASAL